MIRTNFFIFLVCMNVSFFDGAKSGPGYKLRHDKAEVAYVNPQFVNGAYCNFTKFNRTATAFNVGFDLKIDIYNDIKIGLKVYKLINSANYRFAGISFSLNICDAITKNMFGIQQILKTSNVKNCPFKKGKYYIYNAVPDLSKMPSNLPLGTYKLEASFIYNGTLKLGVGNWFGAVLEEDLKW